MENYLDCTCLTEVIVTKKSNTTFLHKVLTFLSSFVIEGAEGMSKTK